MSGAPARLILVGNFLPDRQESMLRFEHALADGYRARGWSVEVWRPEPFLVKAGPRYRYGGLPKYLGYFDKFVLFPRRLRRQARREPPGTVFHILDHSNAVYAPPLRGLPLLVTVHDLLQIRSALGEFPQNRLTPSGARYQQWILDNLRRLPAAACVSEKTRTDLLRLTKLPESAVHVVPNSLNYPYRPMPADDARRTLDGVWHRHGLTGDAQPFLIGIGGAQWYKNRTGLVKIFAALRARPDGIGARHRLIYVGPEWDADQRAVLAQDGLEQAVVRVTGLNNEELRAAYSLAAGLIFPSWEEGFGWPVAEAQACGCPVFTSDRAPMTEVGSDAACYFDPAQPEAAAAVIARALGDTRFATALRESGLIRARAWDPQAMLDAYASLYTLLKRDGRPGGPDRPSA